MIRFEPRASTPLVLLVIVPVLSALAALGSALLILALSGAPTARAAGLLVQGAAGSVFAITETLTRATPLILTGLAAAVTSTPRAPSRRVTWSTASRPSGTTRSAPCCVPWATCRPI